MFNVFKISVFFCFLVLNFNKIDARLPVVPPVHNDNEDNSTNLDCADFPTIKNAALKIDTLGDSKFVQITCDEDYDLFGKSDIFCIRGQWNIDKVPHCEKRCFSPPHIAHGDVVVDQESSRFGEYSKGTLATYSCVEGFTLDPKSSEVRVCENGIWTGPDVECQLSSPGKVCYMPTSIENGFFIPDQPFTIDGYSNYRDKVQYFCEPGYILVGDRTLECSLNGLWMPNIPGCRKNYGGPNSEEKTCDNIDVVAVGEPNYNIYDVMYAVPGQIATVKCKGNYRDALSPCQDSQFRCKKGKWVGVFPICEPAHDCLSPPTTPYGLISTVSYENMNDVSSSAKFPIKSKITYQCEKGFYMEGSPLMKCSPKGCWNPYTPPICIREKEGRGFFLEVNSINAILISTATGAGVIGILLLVCLVVACRKRKALARAVSLQQPTAPRSEMNDHRVLLQPDRLALIAFAESQAGSQNSLPSYEEAVRHHERNCQGGGGGGTLAVTVNRLAYRPHWPNLASGRRARNSPNADVTHVVRHGSLASHTPSTRSCGDSMGSTDTVGFSEVSTNVTLDTASSHSGSQNPSCRAHCGSLASFDGCSLANTEGVPLLEESELEEIHGGNSNSVDNSGGSDNISSKVSTNSAPVMST